MAKIKNNPLMKDTRGMLGKMVVYRVFRGNVVMQNRPKKREQLTPHQEKTKSCFLRAVEYAKKQILNPVTKTLYQPGADSKFTSAYAVALADYLSAPVVHWVDISKYNGVEGDEISIRATDDFSVASVRVSILNAAGDLLEQGMSILRQDAIDDYVYQTKSNNAVLGGTKIIVTVRDRPGNSTVVEKII